jgi:hypothetical protein
MRPRLLVLTVACALIAPAAAGAASLPQRSPLGPAQGVQASVSGTTVTIRFTGASAAWGKAHAGAQVLLTCDVHPAEKLLFSKSADGAAASNVAVRVAEDGGSVRHAFDGPPGDACDVLPEGSGDDLAAGLSARTASAPEAALTPRGAAYLDEQARGIRMMDVLRSGTPKGAYGSAAVAVAAGGGAVVALDDPNGTPPAGKIGYWSKGRAVSVITASAEGRRLVIQDLGNGMVRTNVLESVIGWLPVTPFALPKALTSGGGVYDDDEDDRLVADEGLSVRAGGDRVTFRFSGKAAKVFRHYAGRRIKAGCYAAPAPLLLTEALDLPGSLKLTTVRVPEHGGVITVRAPAGGRDVCGLETLDGRDIGGEALTPAGGRFALQLAAPLFLIFAPYPQVVEAGATHYPGLNTIIAASEDQSLVPLASPGAALGSGKTGFWTDAGLQALYALGAGDGLRLVLADEGHGMARTNMVSAMPVFLSLIATDTPEDSAAATS